MRRPDPDHLLENHSATSDPGDQPTLEFHPAGLPSFHQRLHLSAEQGDGGNADVVAGWTSA
jgi:hypothetical protein